MIENEKKSLISEKLVILSKKSRYLDHLWVIDFVTVKYVDPQAAVGFFKLIKPL